MQRFFLKLMTMKVNVFLVLNSPRCCSLVETRKYLRPPPTSHLPPPQLWLGWRASALTNNKDAGWGLLGGRDRCDFEGLVGRETIIKVSP